MVTYSRFFIICSLRLLFVINRVFGTVYDNEIKLELTLYVIPNNNLLGG